MKKFITICALVFLLSSNNYLCKISQADTLTDTFEEILKMLPLMPEETPMEQPNSIKGTVQIFSVNPEGFGRCSGVLIESKYGINSVLTAKHCIDTDEEMYVEDKLVNFIMTSKDDDLALLIVEGTFLNKNPVKIAKTNPTVNTIGYHFGYPDGNLYQDSGPLKRITKDWEFYEMESKPGCSGGPVFNENEELIGILWGGLRFEETTIVEPLKDIKDFLKEVKLYTKWLNL
jgi:V8-like Glu-specific endopeptidase